jgi:hypothetical protein
MGDCRSLGGIEGIEHVFEYRDPRRRPRNERSDKFSISLAELGVGSVVSGDCPPDPCKKEGDEWWHA